MRTSYLISTCTNLSLKIRVLLFSIRDVSFFKQNHIMAINVKSYPVLFLVIGTFGIMLIFLFHSNREVLHQTYQDNFVNGKSTLEQAQGI